MTFLAAILLTLATLAYLAYLVVFIRNDGHGHRAASGLPRSHHADAFERRVPLT